MRLRLFLELHEPYHTQPGPDDAHLRILYQMVWTGVNVGYTIMCVSMLNIQGALRPWGVSSLWAPQMAQIEAAQPDGASRLPPLSPRSSLPSHIPPWAPGNH